MEYMGKFLPFSEKRPYGRSYLRIKLRRYKEVSLPHPGTKFSGDFQMSNISPDPHDFRIIGGPCKWALSIALFSPSRSEAKKVLLKVIPKGKTRKEEMIISINSITQEDGSGESWLFGGYLQPGGAGYYAKGYYRTDQRSGHMSVTRLS